MSGEAGRRIAARYPAPVAAASAWAAEERGTREHDSVESRTQAVIAAAKIELGQWPQSAPITH